MINRCGWSTSDKFYIDYHDKEWGVPVHDDRLLFEFLILEGAQAGLSWLTILRKRENYRKAFDNFDAEKISRYNKKKIEKLLNNSCIIRNRLKIESTINNAKAFLKVKKEFGSFDKYLWSLFKRSNNNPIVNSPKNLKEIPTKSKESDLISKDLSKRGFKFVGSTICYAFMQAVGMVNDHTVDCFRYKEIIHLYKS